MLESFTWWYVILSIHHLYVTLYKWMGKTCCGKRGCKNTEINKTSHAKSWMCHFVYSYHKTIAGNSFSCIKTEKTQNQNGHCLVKMTRHEKWCFAPIFQTKYLFSVFLSLISFRVILIMYRVWSRNPSEMLFLS